MSEASAERETWTLVLNKYQRDNLLWLINACGYPYRDRDGTLVESVPPFTFANTGDWIGEVAWMLAKEGADPVLDSNDHSNVSLGELRSRVAWWRSVNEEAV